MDVLFSADQFTLKPQSASYFREELFISDTDARQAGISGDGQFGVLSIEPLFPGPPELQLAVRISISAQLQPGQVRINQNFLDSAGIQVSDERFWSVRRAPAVMPVTDAVIELVMEQGNISHEIESLRRDRQQLFLNRCLLAEPRQTVGRLSLPILGRGYFNFRSINPAPETLQSNTLLVFNEHTTLNVFVPHRKSGVDMVIVVDGSGSMDLCDYVTADNRPRTRLEGVKTALEVLFQRRLISGSRVSRIAVVAFGKNTKMLYPRDTEMIELKDDAQISDIRTSTRDLSNIGLTKLGVDRNGTDISAGLRFAAELLDYYFQEGNEKVIILLSDGAHWEENTESVGEIIITSQDPSVLADSLHYDSQVRIHTVAISDEKSLKKYEKPQYWSSKGAVPNTALLNKIADFTDGIFFPSPDARVLTKLFDELGEGQLYQLL